MTENAPPGWYQSETDPPGTERYWDGTQWSAETRGVMAPPPTATGGRMTPHGRELASPGTRVGARLIDFVVMGLLVAAVTLPGFDFDAATLSADSVDPGRLLIGGLLAAAYEIGLVGLKSATLGKMVVGIEIVRKVDGQAPVGLATAVMRWLPFAIGYIPITTVSNLSTLVLLASLVLVFADDLRRSVYDFAGQTYVVRKPRTR